MENYKSQTQGTQPTVPVPSAALPAAQPYNALAGFAPTKGVCPDKRPRDKNHLFQWPEVDGFTKG